MHAMFPPAVVAVALVGVVVIALLVARIWRKPPIASLAPDESAARLQQMQQETTDLLQAKNNLERDLAVEREKSSRISILERELKQLLESVRRHLESLESLVIRWRRPDSQDTSDVDEREPRSI